MPRLTVSIPDELLAKLDLLAKREHRLRSELLREAASRYLSQPKESTIRLSKAATLSLAAVDSSRGNPIPHRQRNRSPRLPRSRCTRRSSYGAGRYGARAGNRKEVEGPGPTDYR
jgi:Arc/MetJ-type ribon-helix-helix transcriptional regulator